MKNKKLWFLIVSLLIVFQLLTLATSAVATESAPTEQAPDDSGYVNWSYNASNNMLTDGKVNYYRYERDHLLTVDPSTVYVYENGIKIPDMESDYSSKVYATVQATSPNSDIVWVHNDITGRIEIFVTKEGARLLDGFLDASTPPNMRLDEGTDSSLMYDSWSNSSSWLEGDTIDTLSKLSLTQNALTIEVTRLSANGKYTLYAFDESKTCLYIQGYIFNHASDLYYVDYASLGNNNFDADGNLSFRSGTVNMVKLSGQLSDDMYDAIDDIRYRRVDYTYEYEEKKLSGEDDGEFFIGVFLFFYSIIGFIAPLVCAIIGVCFANSHKPGQHRHWHILTGISVVWILAAIGLLVILLI